MFNIYFIKIILKYKLKMCIKQSETRKSINFSSLVSGDIYQDNIYFISNVKSLLK